MENTKLSRTKQAKPAKKRRTPKAWFKRYFRVLVGGIVFAAMVLFCLIGPMLTDQDYAKTDMQHRNETPSTEHWFGTDNLGRDYYARITNGGRITLLVAIAAQILTICLGMVLGMLCGYYRRFDAICMRIMEAIHSLPSMLTIIMIASLIGSGIPAVLIALVLGGIVGITRNLRGQVLRLREMEFVEAEKAMGANPLRTLFLHILPHTSSYLIIRFSTGLSSSIMTTASLSYLGIGLPADIPNWGAMISEGQSFMLTNFNLVLWPGLCIMLTMFGASLMGEGIRDILDPKYK